MDDRSEIGGRARGPTCSGAGERAGPGHMAGEGGGAHLSTRTLIGSNVTDAAGDHLGHVEELILDAYDGRLRYVVISVRRHCGIDATLLAVPWRAVRVNRASRRYGVAIEASSFRDAPALQEACWARLSDPAWAQDVHEHYVRAAGSV